MSVQIQCVVVTPERAVFDEKVSFVAVPLYDGELGVLPGRAPLIGRLGYGELRVKEGTLTKRFFIDGGFVQIRDDVVTVLTQRAVPEEELSLEAAEKALEEAHTPGRTPEEQEQQLNKQARARVQMRMVRQKLAAAH